MPGFSAPAQRASEADPVGRPVAGATEALDVHEALQPLDQMVIKFLPVGADPPGDAAQKVTG